MSSPRDYDSDDKGHSDNDQGGHDSGPAIKSIEDLKDLQEKNKRSLVSNIKIEVDEKTGESSVLGIPVPQSMKPLLDYGLDQAKPFLIEQSDKVFRQVSSSALKMG